VSRHRVSGTSYITDKMFRPTVAHEGRSQRLSRCTTAFTSSFPSKISTMLSVHRKVSSVVCILITEYLLIPQEVSLTTLYVSSKLHDTLKKPRDIIISSYAIRYPDLLKGRSQIDISSVDVKQLEHDRKKVLAIERLVLETICFNFLDAGAGAGSGKADVFGLVMKLGRKMRCESSRHHVTSFSSFDNRRLFDIPSSLETVYTARLAVGN
jgi:hypothetical protein